MLTKVQDVMITGLDKSDVGLDSVDNTSDAAKPISTATQTALDLKAPLASPAFTGTVTGVTKAMVGLGDVDNTADSAKPISSATQTALDGKEFTLTAGTNITIDRTTPSAPVISATGGSGSGDVTGPASSVASRIATFSGTTGKVIQDSGTLVADLQPANAKLTAIAALAVTDGNIIVGDGSTFVAESGATARTSLGLGTGNSPEFTAVNLGHASDTTLTRVSAGVIAVEGATILTQTSPVLNTPTLNNAITVEGYAFNTSTNAAVDLANGTLQVPTLTGNWVPDTGWPTATLGQGFRMILKTGAGSFTVTWPSSVKWAGGTAPTITSTASRADIIDFESDGTNWYGYVVGQAYVP